MIFVSGPNKRYGETQLEHDIGLICFDAKISKKKIEKLECGDKTFIIKKFKLAVISSNECNNKITNYLRNSKFEYIQCGNKFFIADKIIEQKIVQRSLF